MDTLISSFVKKIIDELNFKELINLSKLLDTDDENLYKFNQNLTTNTSYRRK